MRNRIKSLLIIGCALLAALDQSPANEPKPDPVLVLENHPLVEKIWDVKNQRFISKKTLLSRALQADYVLLGETHDNPKHHDYQAWVIKGITRADRRPGVAFEMIDDKQSARLTQSKVEDVETLFTRLEWETSGWPDKRLYRPVFQAALDAQLPIVAANLNKDDLRKTIMRGENAIPRQVNEHLAKVTLTPVEKSAMAEEIDDAHCNLMPSKHVEGMILGQRVRDAVMSLSLINNKTVDGAVLIAGKGHVRNDRGVPRYLRQSEEHATITTIAWHEVEETLTQPNEYAKQWRRETLPFNFVWFTTRVERPDPCDALKEKLKQNNQPTVGDDNA